MTLQGTALSHASASPHFAQSSGLKRKRRRTGAPPAQDIPVPAASPAPAEKKLAIGKLAKYSAGMVAVLEACKAVLVLATLSSRQKMKQEMKEAILSLKDVKYRDFFGAGRTTPYPKVKKPDLSFKTILIGASIHTAVQSAKGGIFGALLGYLLNRNLK